MRLQVATYLILGVLSGMQACNSDTTNVDASNQLRARIGVAQEALRRSEVGRVEIVAIPARIQTAVAIRPEDLEQHPDYRLVVRDVRTSALRERLSHAFGSLLVKPSSDLGDVRWGVIFCDVQGKRLVGVFFDPDGRRGAVDSTPASIDGQFFKWLRGTYSDCFP